MLSDREPTGEDLSDELIDSIYNESDEPALIEWGDPIRRWVGPRGGWAALDARIDWRRRVGIYG